MLKQFLNSCCWVPGCWSRSARPLQPAVSLLLLLGTHFHIKALRQSGRWWAGGPSKHSAGDFSVVFFKYILYWWPLSMIMHYKLEHSLSTLSMLPCRQTLPNEPLKALPLTSCWKILSILIWHGKDSSSYLYFYVILNIYRGGFFSYFLYFTSISLCNVGEKTKVCLIWPIFISKVFGLAP